MLSRVLSFNLDSMKRTKSLEFDDNHAVVYDPLNQVLFQGSKQALETESHIEIPIKGCRTKVDLCVPLRTSRPARNQQRAHSDPSFYLATVDLGRLGKNVRHGVKSGKIKNVYVLGYVPDELVDESRGERTDEE